MEFKSLRAIVLFLAGIAVVKAVDNGVQVRLVQPTARIAERSFSTPRNAEAPCPTTKQIHDTPNLIKSGTPLEFVWFNPTAVQGPYRIELLNANYELIATLADSQKSGVFDTNGLTKTKVDIPKSECRDCVLRLLQTTADRKTQLLSCADVDVIHQLPPGTQKCEGEDCLVECTRDSQCGTGKCSAGSCYCEGGFFGPSCLKKSSLSPQNIDYTDYTHEKSSKNATNDLYWRILGNEVELVLQIPVNTWTVFGFRPADAADKCTWLDPNRVVKQKFDSQSGNTLDGFDKIKIQLLNETNNQCGENEAFSQCPEYSRECEASCDWTSFPESIPTCPRACGKARCVCAEGFVRTGNGLDKCVPFNVCQEEVTVECAANETWAKCGQACEPTCKTMYDTAPCKQACAQPSCTCSDNYVRHEGKCILWNHCPNLEAKVLLPSNVIVATTTAPRAASASTTTPKTTPQPPTTEAAEWTAEDISRTPAPTKCQSNETLNECGRICEADCSTLFVRGECAECSTPSCACLQGFARHEGKCIYWGDCPFDDVSTIAPKSTIKHLLEQTAPSTTARTPEDSVDRAKAAAVKTAVVDKPEVSESQDPVPTILNKDPTDEELKRAESDIIGDACFGEWRYPRNCQSNCQYRLAWNLEDETDEIEFSLETTIVDNSWTGVGFSKTGSMRNMDLIVVKSRNGKLTLHDMFSRGYDRPVDDAVQDVSAPTVIGTHVNGTLRAQFTRKRTTGDNSTDLILGGSNAEDCLHFIFPVNGGKLDSYGNIIKHGETPYVTPHPVCVKSCETEDSSDGVDELSCASEYRFPENCNDTSCQYIARWSLNESAMEVRFEIKSQGIGRWTGIGLSRDGQMTNSDIYTGWVYNGKPYVIDRFAYGKQLPAIDSADRQDLYNIEGSIEDEYQTIAFTRKVDTKDKKTDFALDDCFYFLFPIGGGRVLARKSQDFQNPRTPIGYHDMKQPQISTTRICFCNEEEVPLAAIPGGVRRRRAAAVKPSEAPDVLPDLAKIGQISMAEMTGKAAYNVKMDPFACSDVTVIKVLPGGQSRVVDAFAYSKYGLEPDEFYGGVQSYTDISSAENNGRAVVVLRRPLSPADSFDHEFPEGERSQVFWANGPPGNSPVRLSGAANVETFFIDFKQSSTLSPLSTTTLAAPTTNPSERKIGRTQEVPTTPEIADLEDITATTADTVPFNVDSGLLESALPASVQPQTVTPRLPSVATRKLSTIPSATSPAPVGKPLPVSSTPEPVPLAEPETEVPESENENDNDNGIDEDDSIEAVNVNVLESRPQGTPVSVPGSGSSSPCHGTFAYPEGCNDDSCSYSVSWQTDGVNAHFTLSTYISPESWTGIGFSADGAMANADAIIISLLKDSTVTITDQFSPGYGRPNVDDSQDIFGIDTKYSNGVLTANFSRSLTTQDESSDVDLAQCQFFIFIQSPGRLEGGSAGLRKHSETPATSKTHICLGKCGAREEIVSTTPLILETITKKKPDRQDNVQLSKGAGPVQIPPFKPPSHFVYDAVLRFGNLKYSDELEEIQNPSTRKLASAVEQQLGAPLKKHWPENFENIKTVKFAKGDGNVQSLLRLNFNGTNSPDVKQVEQFLRSEASSGKIGDLSVDPKALVLRENKDRNIENEWAPIKNILNYVIIAAILLVLTGILLGLCCWTFRRSKRQSYPAEALSFAPQQMQKNFYNGPYISEPIYDINSDPRLAKRPITTTSSSSPKSSPETNGRTGAGAGSKSHPEETPKGIGETTYKEWHKMVASKDTPTHHQESAAISRPASRLSTAATAVAPPPLPPPAPYVSYPYESGYYTLGGDHRMPPPAYYRHY